MPDVEPIPENIRSIQPGGGSIQTLELAWGRLRRRLLKTFRPAYVRRMQGRLVGDPASAPVEVVDSRDLKYFVNVAQCHFHPSDDPFHWRHDLPFARAGLAELVVFAGGWALLAAACVWPFGVPGLAIVPALGAAFVCWFFRDPERSIPNDPGDIVSPADGKVVEIEEVANHPEIGEDAVKIGIFLSVFNVHVNRSSHAGTVVRLEYRPGAFLNALLPRSADVNERMVITFVEAEPPFRRFVLKQIAGAIARRIVCELRPGERVERGRRIGMIKFGSRTELILAKEGLDVLVRVGDKVRGGSSLLARRRIEDSR